MEVLCSGEIAILSFIVATMVMDIVISKTIIMFEYCVVHCHTSSRSRSRTIFAGPFHMLHVGQHRNHCGSYVCDTRVIVSRAITGQSHGAIHLSHHHSSRSRRCTRLSSNRSRTSASNSRRSTSTRTRSIASGGTSDR